VADSFRDRGLPGDGDPLYQIGVMLINGWGYNWYRLDNRMRADDLLIRERAGSYLAAAAGQLRDLEARYRRKFLPPPSREHPYPEPAHVAGARLFREVEGRIADIETRVRGASVPTNDKVWERHRDEIDTLQRLGKCDALLAAGSKGLDDVVAALPADAPLAAAAERQIDDYLGGLAAVLAQRADILATL
jgi:hypothetical protein